MGQQEDTIEALYEEVKSQRNQNLQLSGTLAGTSFANPKDGTFYEYQLDSSQLLTQIEHFVKGDYYDAEKGTWKKEKNRDLVLFNRYGVSLIMLSISNYIDKNTYLSNYREERIMEIIADIGDELRRVIKCNYIKMGMDTQFKKSRFQITVVNILHIIESAYRRALNGKTFEDINSSNIKLPGSEGEKKTTSGRSFSPFDPRTWF